MVTPASSPEEIDEYIRALTLEAVVLRQEHGDKPGWWRNHTSKYCRGCWAASIRLGYDVGSKHF